MTGLLAHAGRTAWDEWLYVIAPLAVFAFAVGGLAMLGRAAGSGSGLRRLIGRIASALERITGVPGWVVATVGTGVFALLVAVVGFYWDVAWHIDFGRDKELFTPAHTMIVVGLLMIVATAIVEVLFATIQGVDTRVQWKSVRIPYSALPLAALGFGALSGFPLDEVWHHFYGVDVTMWGPTHLIMIAGASFTPIALWLVLAEARIGPNNGNVARLIHTILAIATLTGLSTFQGEFDFGVPQFQLMYQPVLIAAAAGAGLIAARLVLGTGGAVVAAAGFIALRGALAALIGPALGLTTPTFPLYVGGAIGIELVAAVSRWRWSLGFAAAAGLAAGTLGIAGEWAVVAVWARHGWTASLVPPVVLLSILAAVAGAVIGTVLAASALRKPLRFRTPALLAAGVGLVVALILPFPRTATPVHARMDVEAAAGGHATVRLELDPPDAASGARWFEAIAWQGGGLHLVPMVSHGDGRYATKSPVPASGDWKTLIRLHRGSELMAVPVYMPADSEIGARQIPLGDRTVPFARDTALLMREAKGGPPIVARLIYAMLLLIAAAWIALLALSSVKVGASGAQPSRLWANRGSLDRLVRGSTIPSA
ncbi:MAG TPA: hypothetical protein VHI54_06990 [Actinomycetota bacterium]|nr:hypothetical protein [Actinomycetota bacterium]